ncbi:MAG: hypothetical protein ACXWZZ_11865, partial [Solirubrobacteraceae bacterium]
FQMVYMDPPFNTGHDQTRRTLATVAAADGAGDRTGFGGRRARALSPTARLSSRSSRAPRCRSCETVPAPSCCMA